MKKSLQRALAAKQVQREKSAKKSVAEKLATIERMRERRQVIHGRGGTTRDQKG